MHQRAKELVDSGVQVICLLALNDQGSPYYNATNASTFAKNGIPVFACTPDLFPDLMATAIRKQDISIWAAKEDVVIKR